MGAFAVSAPLGRIWTITPAASTEPTTEPAQPPSSPTTSRATLSRSSASSSPTPRPSPTGAHCWVKLRSPRWPPPPPRSSTPRPSRPAASATRSAGCSPRSHPTTARSSTPTTKAAPSRGSRSSTAEAPPRRPSSARSPTTLGASAKPSFTAPRPAPRRPGTGCRRRQRHWHLRREPGQTLHPVLPRRRRRSARANRLGAGALYRQDAGRGSGRRGRI